MGGEFRRRIRARDPLIGTLAGLPSPEVVEILAHAGFDWLFLDMEHGAFDPLRAQALLQAAGPGCPCLLRVPSHDEVWIKKALDIGAAGVIVPQVNSAAQAERIVSLCRYPPAGTRGVGIARAQGYGAGIVDYMRRANDEICVVIQAEHIEAVANIDAIAKVDGVDAVFIGPYDLSASMGRPGAIDDPAVQAAIGKIIDTCKAAGRVLGTLGMSAEAARRELQRGCTLMAVGCDSVLLHNAAVGILSDMRR